VSSIPLCVSGAVIDARFLLTFLCPGGVGGPNTDCLLGWKLRLVNMFSSFTSWAIPGSIANFGLGFYDHDRS